MRLSLPSPRVALGAGFLLVLLLAAALVQLAPTLDNRVLDAQFALNRDYFPKPIARDVVVVGIDEAFLDTIDEPLSLSHAYLAQFLTTVSEAGAVVIGLDLVLPDRRFDKLASLTNPELDYHRTLLMGLMQSSQRSTLVLAKVWDYKRSSFRDIQLDYAAILGQQQPIQALASAMLCSDDDGRIRRYPDPSWDCQPDRSPHTLSGEVAAAMGAPGPWKGLIDYQLGDEFVYKPLQEVLGYARAGYTSRLEQLFKGKAVLIGTVQDDTDMVRAPVELARWLKTDKTKIPGMLVHAQAMRSMLNGGFIGTLPASWLWAVSLTGVLFWFGVSVRRKMLLLVLLSLVLLVASNVLLQQGTWIAPTGLLLVAWLAGLARSAWQALLAFGERQRLSRTFSGYVSPGVMQQILAGGVDTGSSVKTHVCVLFSDIRNFTTMSEAMDAAQVVLLLNRYFGRMTAIVHRHGGTVDKFIGDGMMAFFGAPNTLPSPETSALEAACDMLAELGELNAELAGEGGPELKIGIGLHSGLAVIGYVGSSDRHEYTAIGDAVNVSARLEGLSKVVGYPIVCSDSVARQLGPSWKLDALGMHPLKGHTDVPVFGWRPA
ncbi:MAG: adenylate/guanylate cyclase domain-containing protein [Pseudomonadota bacterium]